MADEPKYEVLQDILKRKAIRPETKQMEAFLGVGYGLTVDEAEQVIALAKKDPLAYPIAEVRKAKAFLAAYHTAPTVVATRPGWTPPVMAE